MRNSFILFLSLVYFAGCASNSPPSTTTDVCKIFKERYSWYKAAKKTEKRWKIPVYVSMAIIKQESSFRADARPERTKLLGFIPWKRPTTAKGYSQAIEGTWEQYQKETGQNRANRSNFDNSVDFIGWYLSKASSVRIRSYEVDKLYLAYHEGYGGYKRRSYNDKDWLLDVAKKVKYNAVRYERQIKNCPLKESKSFWDIF